MRITFVHTPMDRYDQNYGTQFTPLWAYYLAANVPDDWEIDIVDTRIDSLDRCRASDVFAFSGINQDEPRIHDALLALRRRYPDARFILGGPITWSFEQEGKLDRLDGFDHLFVMDGEAALPRYLDMVAAGTDDRLEHVVRPPRFRFAEARMPRVDLLDRSRPYYGAVIEVSRGCPFLCEFCDIRVLPDNNRTHVKPVDAVVAELDAYWRRGVRQFQFACDNFIGDLGWARACAAAIAAWRERTGAEISIFTWLTINLCREAKLMRTMRRAGFTTLFIGIESVNRNALLEAAKVQNLNGLEQALERIHGYGFIVAPGFIFVFEDTLEFMERSGTLGGDPSFLTALAGTPLFERMRRTGRLVERPAGAIERHKIVTNIRYLQDEQSLRTGFVRFVRGFTAPRFQLDRLRRHVEILDRSADHVPTTGRGYASLVPYLRRQLSVPTYRSMLVRRVRYMLRPDRLLAALRGWWLTRRASRRLGRLNEHFLYWLYAWTNLALKYDGLTPDQMQLHSVEPGFDVNAILCEDTGDRAPDGPRTAAAQARHTRQALEQVVQLRVECEAA